MLGESQKTRSRWIRAPRPSSVPGLAFAEHGPRASGLSYGYLEDWADPSCRRRWWPPGHGARAEEGRRGMFVVDNVLLESVATQIDRGVMIGAGRREDSAEGVREYSGWTMPW